MENTEQKPPVVLVVDDDELAIKAVVQLLSRRGFQMLSATSGRQALEVLSKKPVDVLVLDVLMPEMTGLDVCRTLRSDGRFNELPIILLTGCDDVETRAAGMKLGVSDFLCKPFAHHELIAKIQNQLNVRRISADLDSLADQL